MVITQIIKENPVLTAGLAATAGAMWGQLKEATSGVIERQFAASMTLENSDHAFLWVDRWLSQNTDLKKSRTMHVRVRNASPLPGDALEDVYRLGPGAGLHTFRFRGKRVWMSKGIRRSDKSHRVEISCEFYVFGRNRELFLQMLKEALELYLQEERQGIQARVASAGSWEYLEPLPDRMADSVVLAEGVMEGLLEDLRSFLNDKKWYANLSIPHRRGVLLHGPPGSGKTSTILAVASELRCKLYWVPISASWMSDTVLMNLLLEVPERSIVVLEDIDAAFDGREVGKQGSKNLTFSRLLNALDGVMSSQGRILFMTTNHPEKLDPALVRPGRIDLRVEIGLPTFEQRRRLFERFFPGDLRSLEFAGLVPDTVGMSALQELLLGCRYDSDKAVTMAKAYAELPERELVRS